MDNKFDIDGLTRETKRREYEDGLRDFQLGAIFLLVGLANWFIFTPAGLDLFARTVLRLGDLLLPAFLGFVGLFFLGLFGSERIMAQIRRATFWKESGFVKPLRSGVIKIGATVLAAVVLLGIIIGSVWLMARGILSQEAALRSIPASVGLGTAIIFTSLGLTLQMRRYILVGVSGAILSGIILLADITFATSYLWAGIGWAVIFAASGIWALNWAIRDLRGRAING
jgi:hypothetical protein